MGHRRLAVSSAAGDSHPIVDGRWNTSKARRVWTFVDYRGPVRVLAMSGSLRRASSNDALVGAVARLVPDTTLEVSVCRELEALPPFNPDLDGDNAPDAVVRFRAALQACDAVLISSPGCAYGPRGVLENALDWLVPSGELVDKPIALINASARARHTWASVAETSAVMSAHVILEAWITVPHDSRGLDANGIVVDAGFSATLMSAIAALAIAARDARLPKRARGSSRRCRCP